MLGRRTR